MAATEVLERRATIDDLYNVEGPAELINGKIILDWAGERPGEVCGNILANRWTYAKHLRIGQVYGNGLGYVVPLMASGRESFCPDVSFHTKERPKNRMLFVDGAPDFAAEVRGEDDYGPADEERRAAKRTDYFLSGTLVVWDVDVLAETVRIYRVPLPNLGELRVRGEAADAKPAVPGWEMKVDEVFE